MVQTAIRRPVETPAEKLRRLVALARAEGVELLRESTTGEVFATSATVAGEIYRLTDRTCTCPGFERWGRCKHHSLLLAELGQLPALAPAAVTVCPACGGRGVDPACRGHRVTGGAVTCPCERCQGTGTVAPAITERPARLAA